jgi:sugar lactone lactonase YvrE
MVSTDTLEPIRRIGTGLCRPECVVVAADGTLFVSDARGGAMRLDGDAAATHLPCPGGTTNGLALDRDGRLIFANIDSGTIHQRRPDGTTQMLLDSLAGEPLGAVNFVYFDARGELWATISTRTQPRSRAIAAPIPDGYLLKLTPAGPRLMADGLCFANEVRVDVARNMIFIAESARGRVLGAPLLADGTLGAITPFGPDPLFPGAVVDGLALDVEGGLWVTEVTRNGIHRIDPAGHARCMFEDPQAGLLDFPASLAFGGPDGKTAFVGSIRMDSILTFRSPVAGARMWHSA